MDPFSLTVGILTTLEAGGKIGRGLKKVIALRKAPDILLALNNEVVDLQIVVEDVDDLLRQHEQIALGPTRSLCQALERSKETLLRLESLISYELTTTTGRERRLDRSAWLRKEHDVLVLRDRTRADRFHLLSALGILAASNSLRADRQIGQLRMTMETLDLKVSRTGGELSSQIKSLTESNHTWFENVCGLNANFGQHNGTRTISISASQCDDSLPRVQHLTRQSVAQDVSTPPWPQPQHLEPAPAVRLSFHRSSHNIGCGCVCHKRSRLQSPKYLNAVLGSMMVGYSALPWFAQACDDVSCRDRSAKITYTYVFPQWFASRALYLKIANDNVKSPELCLRVVRVRPLEANVFFAAQVEDEDWGIHHIKRLLLTGEASVLDVNPRGETALARAVLSRKAAMIELLIKAGSDPLYEDINGWSPYTLAWTEILTAQVSCKNESLSALRQIFHDQSHLNVFNFPDLLRAYLDLSGKTFGSILSLTLRSAIDQVDVNGRTTLSWAAQKGDSEIVIRLLGCGADPNCADSSGLRPLHWSVHAATNECTRILLAAKAEVDAKGKYGKTALAYAVNLSDDVSFTELLLSHGADIESQDETGHRLLHCAMHGNRSTQVSVLLENGIDVNALSSIGMTAVAYAIMFNSHDALRVLLNYGKLDYECKDNFGCLLTHLAAQFGDIETLYVLQSAGLSRINLNTKSAHGYTALDWAKWRRHYNEQWACWAIQKQDEDPLHWFATFEAFIEGIADTQRAESEGSGPTEQTRDEDSSREYLSEEGASKDDDEPEAWYDVPEEAD